MHSKRPVENILVSSTRQWNPGDEFIWFGVRRLFEASFKPPFNYLLWNRNPDVFIDGWANAQIKPRLYSNCLVKPAIDLIDRVVLAGSPEWLGPPLIDVYRSLLIHKEVPLYAIGVGSGQAEVFRNDAEHEVLSRENSIVICRQKSLRDNLISEGVKKVFALPCPALFSAASFKDCASLEDKKGKIGLIVQSDAVPNQAVPASVYESCKNLLRSSQIKDYETHLICFYTDEFLKFSRLYPDMPVRYVYQSEDYEKILLDYDVIISTRLHGAIHALSMGIPSALVSQGNFRVEATAAMFEELLPVFPNFEDAYGWAAEQQRKCTFAEFAGKIARFKAKVFDQYQALLGAEAKR